MPSPIDTSSVLGPEWQIAPITPAQPAQGSGDGGFAGALGQAVQSLQTDQQHAADAVQSMVTGQAQDPTEAVMALERARLSMQLAGQIRNKAVEAFQDVFHTQV